MLRSSGFERTAIPLRTQAILDWELGDAFGTVLREAAGNYGMIFEETVSPKLLIATRDLHDNLASQGGLDYLVKEAARNFVHGRK